MIERNTEGTNTLKADAFATADCKFQLGNITSPYSAAAPTAVPGFPAGTTLSMTATPPLTPLIGAGTVNDDPTTTDCDENQLLLRQPDGTIQYRSTNKIDPAGINGQSVYNGTANADKVTGGNDNDTFWGNAGNDRIEGNGGDDVALGGDGNDIITDLDGADTPKGGPGNDAIDGGPGDDIPMGNAGNDFLNGGANDNESFAGPGNDYVIAGQGADTVFGDGGDDWLEGGTGQDLLQGDHGAPFFDDPGEKSPGNDIFVGQPGENDYDTEGGDDIMAQNAAIDRNAGAGGFDWAIHQYDTVGGDDDLEINQQLAGLPLPIVVNRDRWQETEADSGSNFNDVIRGDALERIVGGFGFTGCDALDPAGVARITGLGDYVKTFPTPVADVIAVSAAGSCPLEGAPVTLTNPVAGGVWAEGNILFGGGGSDVIEGRENDDIIDGDSALRVAITVRTDPTDPSTEIGRTDLMEGKAQGTGTFGPGTAGMTLQQAVFAGLVDPGNLVNVREIVNPSGAVIPTTPTLQNPNPTPDRAAAGDCPAATPDPATPVDGVVGSTVKLTAAVTNCDTAVFSEEPAAGPAGFTITANADGSVTVADNASVAAGPPFPKGDGVDTLWNIENLRFCIHDDPVLKTCDAFTDVSVAPRVQLSATSLAFGNQAVGTTSATQNVTVRNTGIAALKVTNVTVTGTDPTLFTATPAAGCTSIAGGGSCVVAVRFAPNSTGAKSATVNIVDNAAGSPHSVAVTGTGIATAPGAPLIGTAVAGNTTATVNWTAPSNGGSAITGYSVRVLNAANAQVGALRPAGAAATSLVVTGLTNGTTYHFTVTATNAIGTGPASASSNAVTPATVPGAPVIGNAQQGANGGALTATANWTPPASNGGSAITGYVVVTLHMSSNANNATVLSSSDSAIQPATARSLSVTLPAGSYRFQVRAINAVGSGPLSARSGAVTPR
jgi:Ca2+-binding RTX toxin-like protein